MLTPEYLSWITDRAEEVASSLFSRILNKIIERIFARFKRQDDYVLTSVDKHNIDTLQEAGYLLDDIQKEIVEATGIEAKVIKEAFEDAGIEGMEIDGEVYDQVGIDVPDLTESPAAIRAMQRNYEATMGEWKNLTGTTAMDADNKFIEACDEAFTNVNSGAMGLDQAIKEAIDKLVEEGITAVHYASGRTDSIDVAIARAVRTGIAQAAAQVTLTRMKEMGVDLLITSAHLGARPSHEAWQGQIFHVDWSTIDIYRRYTKDDSVPNPNTASKYPDFVQSTRFGFVDGLCGANCRHSFSPYFEGMPNPYADFDNKKSREIYKLEQKQRAMERAIRKTKREKAAYKTAMDNAPEGMKDIYKEEYDKRVDKLRNQSKEYNAYCADNGLRPLEARLAINPRTADVIRSGHNEMKGGRVYSPLHFQLIVPRMKNSIYKTLLSESILRTKYEPIQALTPGYFKGTILYTEEMRLSSYIHEHFHEILDHYGRPFYFTKALEEDYDALVELNMGNFPEAMYQKFPQLMYKVGNKYRVYGKCSGISDIIHGMTEGVIWLGYGHREKGYWDDPTALPEEAFADFGTTIICGGSDAKKMFMEYFPNFYKACLKYFEEIIYYV